MDRFNKEKRRIELFAPTIRLSENVGGKIVFRDRPLTFHYVFVRGVLEDVRSLCVSGDNGFSFLLNHSSKGRYGTVSDEAMASFMQIARRLDNFLPFYDIEGIDLEYGDLVEVVDGQLAGLTGIFMPKNRSNKGNLVIAATAKLGTVVYDVEARHVRILKFARDTRRQYDLLDSFIPKLFPIMRKFHAGERLDERQKSSLAVFCRRMAVVVPDNHKLEAKLSATLTCAQYILGDMQAYREASARFERRSNAVTNGWTRALIDLLLAVPQGDMTRIADAYKAIAGTAGPMSRLQKSIMEEYRFYLGQIGELIE